MTMFWIIALMLGRALVAAGEDYPSCSDACITAAIPSTCNSSDNVCICEQMNQTALLTCLASACDCTDQHTAASDLDTVCTSNGVQLDLNVACAAASSPSSEVAAATSSITSQSSEASSIVVVSSSALSPVTTVTSSAPTSSNTSTVVTSSTSLVAALSTTTVASSTSIVITSVSKSPVAIISSGSDGLVTSTAVVVLGTGVSTVIVVSTSTRTYTPSPSTISSSSPSTSVSSSNSSAATAIPNTTGGLIHHGLSTGAKAGIGAGVAAVVVAACVLTAWLFWFCRQRRHKTSSITDADHYPPSNASAFPAVGAVSEKRSNRNEKRISELPSEAETTSRKPPFSWGSSSNGESRHQRTASGESGSNQPISSEEGSGQHSPEIDITAYQRPILGHDGFWHNAQELQGGTAPHSAAATGHANPAQESYRGVSPTNPAATGYADVNLGQDLRKVQSRPIIPPGRWPPNTPYGMLS